MCVGVWLVLWWGVAVWLDGPAMVKEVCVVSEARNLEVHADVGDSATSGDAGRYLGTIRATVDESVGGELKRGIDEAAAALYKEGKVVPVVLRKGVLSFTSAGCSSFVIRLLSLPCKQRCVIEAVDVVTTKSGGRGAPVLTGAPGTVPSPEAVRQGMQAMTSLIGAGNKGSGFGAGGPGGAPGAGGPLSGMLAMLMSANSNGSGGSRIGMRVPISDVGSEHSSLKPKGAPRRQNVPATGEVPHAPADQVRSAQNVATPPLHASPTRTPTARTTIGSGASTSAHLFEAFQAKLLDSIDKKLLDSEKRITAKLDSLEQALSARIDRLETAVQAAAARPHDP